MWSHRKASPTQRIVKALSSLLLPNKAKQRLEAIAPNRMNPESVNAAVVSRSEKEKYIRITSSGKLKAWVSYSLHFLEVQRLNGALVSIQS